MNNGLKKAGVQAWFVYRRIDRINLYSRIYSALTGNILPEKAAAFNVISMSLLSQIKSHYPWIKAEKLHNIELDTHEIRTLYGKYVVLVLIARRGKSIKKIYQLHEKMLSIIETDAEGRLASHVHEPEILRDIWVKCEELLRPYIIHLF
ncbi:MAG: hypothetical protein ACFFFH_20290 [Candidatus Thorarchaeota archaeon]